MSPFFVPEKASLNLSAANRNRLMALLNTPSTVFASPQPACRIPPKKTSSYRGCGSPETGYRYPSRESRLPTPSAMAVSCMGRSRSIERQTSCPSSCPALRVRPFRLSPRYPSSPPCPPAAYGGGTAGFDVFRGGLGRVGNDGREGGPSLLCAGLLKAPKAWNRQCPAVQGIATGRAVAAVSMRKGEPAVISRVFSP